LAAGPENVLPGDGAVREAELDRGAESAGEQRAVPDDPGVFELLGQVRLREPAHLTVGEEREGERVPVANDSEERAAAEGVHPGQKRVARKNHQVQCQGHGGDRWP
jgi:hypothetical protein